MHFNQLTPAEAERLAILAEECAEVIQIIGKILRHGYESYNPTDPDQTTNRELLTAEIGHVQAAKEMMQDALDILTISVIDAKQHKLANIGRYLHHHAVLPHATAPRSDPTALEPADSTGPMDDLSELTCFKCPKRSTCPFVDDAYNTNGDCLAEK